MAKLINKKGTIGYVAADSAKALIDSASDKARSNYPDDAWRRDVCEVGLLRGIIERLVEARDNAALTLGPGEWVDIIAKDNHRLTIHIGGQVVVSDRVLVEVKE